VVSGPSYSSVYGEVSTIDCSAILDGAKLQLFATNRSLEEVAEISVDLADRDITGLDSAELLTGPDAKAANSFDAPDVVCSRAFDDVVIRNGRAHIELPPLSLLAATLDLGS
jgi:alpha-L-arabinofuranosidase